MSTDSSITNLLSSANAREFIASRSARAKDSRLFDTALRHNPAIQRPIARIAERYDRAGPDERDEIRRSMLARTLARATETGYGRRVAPPNSGDLTAWPILEKEAVRAEPAAFETVRRLPAVPATTGGTTGTPLRLIRSLTSLNAEQFFLNRLLERHGVSFALSRVALLRSENVKDLSDTEAPFGRRGQSGRLLVLSAQHLERSNIGWYVDELRRFRADFLWAYPSALSSLARLVESEGLSLDLPLVVTSSEMLTPIERELARSVLGTSVVDYYGQAERVALASDAGADGYRFDPLYGTVELHPAAPEGQTLDGSAGDGRFRSERMASAEIIGTGHWNSAMPLVRYRVGDAILYRPDGSADQLERIAAGDAAFAGFRGRDNEVLVSPEGRVLVGINHLPRGLDSVVRMQVRQPEPNRVTVLVVTRDGFSDTDRATLDRTIAVKIPPSMRVTVEEVDELPRTEAGKTPFVVRAPGIDPH